MRKVLLVGGLVMALCGTANASPKPTPCTAEEAGPISTCVVLHSTEDLGQWFSGRYVRLGYAYEAFAPWGKLNPHPVPNREWISRYRGHGLFMELCACRERSGPSSIRVRYSSDRPVPIVLRYAFG